MNAHCTRLLAAFSFCLVLLASARLYAQGPAPNTTQQLAFAGLRTAGMQGQFNGVKTDGAGNLYLLLDQKDGVRLLKTDNAAQSILAQALLGATGDIGTALALDPAGNIYVAGTTTSTKLTATAGAAIATRTDSSTNSFVAKFDANLNPLFVSFTGGSKIAASALAATADAVFVTGTTYATNLPVTAAGIQQAPASGSFGNGFVERFNSAGSTLVYATYLTGASGDTTPTAIAADANDNAYIAGSTSASGFPTVAALVPAMLGSPSGFLTRLTPAGDAFTWSTFIPGAGVTSLSLNAAGSALLASGTVSLGQFPVDTNAAPLAGLPYQVLLQLPLDGQSVTSGTVLAPGMQSFAAALPNGGVWVDGALSLPLLPALDESGSVFALRLNPSNVIDQSARFGGLPTSNPTFASLPGVVSAVAVDPVGEPLIAGAVEPTASSSLLATETYDLPLRNTPTQPLPSGIAAAQQTASTCNGSLCTGSAASLSKLNPGISAPALSFSSGTLPFVTLRNLGSLAATGLTVTATGSTVNSNCGQTLAPGAQCNLLLSDGQAGTLTAASAGDTQTLNFPAYAAAVPASTIVFFPAELDFGIQTATSPAGQRTITVSNLGTTSQTFTSALDAANLKNANATPYAEASSDCTTAGSNTKKLLAPGGTCHIVIALTASATAGNNGLQQADWSIGTHDVLLTGFTQSTALNVSATEVDFGTQFVGGLKLPRYLYLSNPSSNAVSHAALSLPASTRFTLTDSCPATLAAGTVCRIRIDYSSPAASSDSAALTLDGGLQVLLTGTTLPARTAGGATANPNLSVTPLAVTFPDAVVVTGVSSSAQSVGITNTGTAPFSLSLALSGDFTDVTSCGATLAGGATCAVALSFAPAAAGTRTGLLAVTAGAGTTPVYVSLTGTGAALLPTGNGTLDQGSSPVGQPVVQYYNISQPITSLAVTATGPFEVALVEDTGNGHGSLPGSAFSASLTQACHNCYLAVQFTPTAAGAATGTLQLSSAPGGSTLVLSLIGTGTAVTGLVLSPGAQDFGAVPVHSASGTVTFTLTNLSGAPATLAGPAVTGDYALSTNPSTNQACTGTLAAGAACDTLVIFQPAAIGTRTGTLTLGMATASLTGTGTADPGLAINPLALTFANVNGPLATRQTVTLTNTGTALLPVGAPAVSSASFAVSSNCTTLAPAASCTLAVNFTPGNATANGTLSFSAGGQPYTVALLGTYTASAAGISIAPNSTSFGAIPVGSISAPRTFTINNLTARAYALSVQIPRQFALSGPPCTILAANSSCSFQVAFAPLDNGDAPGTLLVQATPSDGSATLVAISNPEGYGTGTGTLTVTGGLITNGSFNFGQIASGQTASQAFLVSNAGATPVTVRRVSSNPPFLSTTTCGAMLAPAQSCAVTVTYAPQNQVAAGSTAPASTMDAGTLTLESDAGNSPNVFNLTGQAGPVVSSSPANSNPLATFIVSGGSLTFASVAVGNASPAQTLILTNTGTVNEHVLSTSTSADFAVSGNCGTLTPGASCQLSVTSTPQTTGTHLASLEVATDAATSLEFVSLLATGTPSTLVFSPASLVFSPTLVGASSTLPLQVSNTGAAPVTFISVSATGDFTVAAGTCPGAGGTLAAGTSCTLQVTFSPAAAGSRSGTLALASSASTLPLTVPLSGTGLVSHLTVSPAALSFGSTATGISLSQSLTVSNTGTSAITGLTLTTTGDFAVTTTCPATLAAGTSCLPQVTFTPTATGARTGTLVLTSSDPASPLTIPLSGTGAVPPSFTLTVDGGASSSVTVPSGAPATYHLALAPVGGFTGTVALTCAPVVPAPYASCSLTPASLTLAGGAVTGSATINTITSSNGNAISTPARTLALLLPGALLLLMRRRLRLARLLSLALLAGLLASVGCGSSPSDTDPNARYTPPGTYQYQVTATSTTGPLTTATVTLNLVVTPKP